MLLFAKARPNLCGIPGGRGEAASRSFGRLPGQLGAGIGSDPLGSTSYEGVRIWKDSYIYSQQALAKG